MEKNYDFTTFEGNCLELWKTHKILHPSSDRVFSIASPPPNVSGQLHIGHALNNTLQDCLVRYHRMQGDTISYINGTDSAGISTQYVVTKNLIKNNINPTTLSKQELVEAIEDWVKKYGNIILEQQRRIGISADWDKTRYTKDPKYDRLVKESFVKLYIDGLIYRGNYLVNWCSKCGTTLADDEVNSSPYDSYLYYIKYKLENSDEYITIATTRPETIFGDTAVAYNPDDDRYQHLNGKKCIIPIINKPIPIISDKEISKEFGTGLMKITPSHNKVDYELGKKHNLEMVTIIDKFGKLCNTGLEYDGIKLLMLRDKIEERLKIDNLIEKIKYETLNKTCYKCNTYVENILSDQWFVNMKPLAEKAIEVADELNFFPEFHKKVYLHWLNNTTDWCISRQISWAHDIPIYYCKDCDNIIASVDNITECNKCKSINIEKENDVLDTWFSSCLYSFAVFDNEDDYNKFFPLSVIISGSDILFFWITRMIMMSLYFKKKIPFKDIYLHGLIRDEHNTKMSKTLGNVIDPISIIDKIGTDAMRFGLIYNYNEGKDIKLGMKHFDIGRTFCTKLWNSVRYILTTRKLDYDIKHINIDGISEKNLIQINRLKEITNNSVNDLEKYNFGSYIKNIYTFMWDIFCNDYLEHNKSDESIETTNILLYNIIQIIKLLHPIIPFITEEIYQKLKNIFKQLDLLEKETLMISRFII
jgi:valyl-tRNA synthetase